MSVQNAPHEDHFRAGKALGLEHVKLGMWLFIGSEVMFFGGLIAAFLHYKVNNPSPIETALLDVVLVGINTFILLSSSFTVVLGLSSIQRDDRSGLIRYLSLTAILGSVFLAGQVYEFFALYQEGVTLSSSVFGSSFFTLTGFHGLHVLIGVGWALGTLLKAARGGYSSTNNIGVEIFGLYWHFVDVVWIVLFTIIYLI
ncbi:MAG: heme-copper oxidase subunit III [Anaerolineales bacterium]|nr:MAG: heme-copper oxidase subunit III [Anaerolineales bacterium]